MTVNAEEHDARGGGIQVIARAAEILRLLQAHPGGLNQAAISERLGMARSTVSRILNALDDEGLVTAGAARGRFRLGPEIARMARTVRLSLVMDLHPFLEELSRELQETVDLSMLDGDRANFVDQVIAPHRLRAISAVGESFPLYCCANGKAMLASLPPVQRTQALPSRLTRLTANTITTRAVLHKELDRIRVEGVAYDREEQSEGICAVGAVLQAATEQMAAVSVPVPAQRFYGRESELAQALLAWVEKVNNWLENV
ncbi:IclR family transcriptional regulator [Mycobacterium haemophilum]|uniref:Transcriptional regulator n=1 Tax=Mycobacterium haemophilum TaxID=29311 RepID=A0A0I9TZ91_9MYCO|nr:IclR family transcriptional regulator [Mycobacterium haemophilum]KLO27351.1 transcriptional regulator [Mycobacterium haemophilum]KLO35066.1 transcriptional regulator [Mycobacterium haemophilum]KLO40012.1 transcriptional regulator [Mycobacterium haemophilum]KLO47341.1 transcriptional regulator [Mycobacterium haemophilum]